MRLRRHAADIFRRACNCPVRSFGRGHRPSARMTGKVRAIGVAQGIEIVSSTPQEFAAIIKRDAEIWAKVVKATGGTVD